MEYGFEFRRLVTGACGRNDRLFRQPFNTSDCVLVTLLGAGSKYPTRSLLIKEGLVCSQWKAGAPPRHGKHAEVDAHTAPTGRIYRDGCPCSSQCLTFTLLFAWTPVSVILPSMFRAGLSRSVKALWEYSHRPTQKWVSWLITNLVNSMKARIFVSTLMWFICMSTDNSCSLGTWTWLWFHRGFYISFCDC